MNIQSAVNEQQLRQCLGLTKTTGKNGKPQQGQRPIELFMCSVIKRAGFADGFKWLSNFIE